MPTINQLVRNRRKKVTKRTNTPHCKLSRDGRLRARTPPPPKPNSTLQKVAKYG
jgi:small subunit ribosomal protein S12